MLGEVKLQELFNDGMFGTGTTDDMALRERNRLAQNGLVVIAVDISRPARRGNDAGEGRLRCKLKVTARGMWTDDGRLLKELHTVCLAALQPAPSNSRCAPPRRRRCCCAAHTRLGPLHSPPRSKPPSCAAVHAGFGRSRRRSGARR